MIPFEILKCIKKEFYEKYYVEKVIMQWSRRLETNRVREFLCIEKLSNTDFKGYYEVEYI